MIKYALPKEFWILHEEDRVGLDWGILILQSFR